MLLLVQRNLLRFYNRVNIALRWIVGFFYKGKRNLPLLHCSFRKILVKNFAKNSEFYFFQVGAFDGISFDFLYEFVANRNSFGVVIEPIEEYYELLVANYSFNANIIPLNTAIHSDLKKIILHKVGKNALAGLPDWARGISSIHQSHLKAKAVPKDAIVTEEVSAMHMMDAVKAFYVHHKMNLLQIDVEGDDFQVLNQFDFSVILPDMVKIEYVNLCMQQVKAVIDKLRYHKYYCLYDREDIIGIQLSKIRL